VLASQLEQFENWPGQSVVFAQTWPQLPLLRHVWPVGQEQATDWPQVPVLFTVSQRPGQGTLMSHWKVQMSLFDFGVQQVPVRQNCPAAQLPHEPPQPSSPHRLRPQCGVQVGDGGDGGL
jgi:hypothetical protein